ADELVNKARIYYTGIQRSATMVLKTQNTAAASKTAKDHGRVVDALLKIKDIGYQIRDAFVNQDLDRFARLMDEHWMHKRSMSAAISLTSIDDMYDHVKKEYGVLGGKIIGAGGGGFVMLYCPEKGRELDAFMAGHDMPRIGYYPSSHGSRITADLSDYDDFNG
ncbi:MAG TPA: hypothetical protein PKA51_01225, partial [Kiritimatiellia bacterium]|nr:hypothetical protein [Kiritimatiellia bacterium]